MMKMEVAVAVPMRDILFFDNVPSMTAPSTPKFSGDHMDYMNQHASAPSSPTRAAAIYAHFADLNHQMEDWDENPKDDDDAAFDFAFSGPLGKGKVAPQLATADELFEAGMIRPLKPRALSPRSPKSKGFWSPRHHSGEGHRVDSAAARDREGRQRTVLSSTCPSEGSRRVSRSLSPLRSGEGVFHQKTPTSTDICCAKSTSGGSKRWRLRDLFLFRSASEGRATGKGSKDPLRKYTFRSSMKDSRTASAHEIHYTANRAASEEKKKKTPLPYGSHGLFGYLRFNPAVQSISRGFMNSSAFSRSRT